MVFLVRRFLPPPPPPPPPTAYSYHYHLSTLSSSGLGAYSPSTFVHAPHIQISSLQPHDHMVSFPLWGCMWFLFLYEVVCSFFSFMRLYVLESPSAINETQLILLHRLFPNTKSSLTLHPWWRTYVIASILRLMHLPPIHEPLIGLIYLTTCWTHRTELALEFYI